MTEFICSTIVSIGMKIIKYAFLVAVATVMVACNKTDHNVFYQEIKSADKMVFASMAITKTAVMDDAKYDFLGDRVAVYSYNSYMQAFINLTDLLPSDIVFDDKNHTVTVTLPAVQTELTGRDMQMRKVYENIGLLRADLDSQERAQMKEKANQDLNREVVNNPAFRQQLTDAAKRKARAYFEAMFESTGYTPTINFKN